MPRVAREIMIHAAIEDVFRCLADPAERALWLATMIEEPLPQGARLDVGTTIRAKRKRSTTGGRYELTVTTLDAPRVLAMSVRRNGKDAGSARFELSPAAGGTLVRDVGEAMLHGAERLLSGVIAATMEKDMAEELAALKRHVESRGKG